MANAANANMNAVRETMDGKDRCTGPYNDQTMSVLITTTDGSITMFFSTVLLEISRLLNTGLDMESLSICVRLCEQGINPEALSAVIKELRKASESLKVPASVDTQRALCTFNENTMWNNYVPAKRHQ